MGGWGAKAVVCRIAEPEHVSDEALAYLNFQETLYYRSPGQGHDAVFREFENLWTATTRPDMLPATLGGESDLDPARCRTAEVDA